MNKLICTIIACTLACISTFTFVNLSIIENTEEIIKRVDAITTIELSRVSAPLEPNYAIEEPIEEVKEVVEPTIEEKLSELSIANTYAKEAEYLAKTVWGEARGCSTTEQAAVIWCILNRVDDESFPNDIIEVITAKNQFHGYQPNFPVTDELYELAIDILGRWELEKAGHENVGRVLPNNYYWFHGDGKHNHFRIEYKGKNYWDWRLESPYED